LLVNLALVDEDFGQPEAALADYQAAQQWAGRSALPLDAADVLDSAGRFFLRRHQEEAAARALEQSLELAEILLAADDPEEGRVDGVALHEAVMPGGGWRKQPFVHLGCCHGGAQRYRGGGQESPARPNFADQEVPLAVPGVELVVPEPGSGYRLLSSPASGEVTLRAFATPEPLSVPLLFERHTMQWLARGPEGEQLRRGFRQARREALRQLHARWHHQPGRLAVAEQTVRITPGPGT
jgi:hypothetical protein